MNMDPNDPNFIEKLADLLGVNPENLLDFLEAESEGGDDEPLEDEDSE
jgi:hypothetical protein